jgi:hypothetical protein
MDKTNSNRAAASVFAMIQFHVVVKLLFIVEQGKGIDLLCTISE